MKKKNSPGYLVKLSERNSKKLKYEFLPDALEFIERPTAPGSKVVIVSIFMILIAWLLWACLGQVDVVVTMRGVTQPANHVQAVQAQQQGVVKKVCVEEGALVTQGAAIIELDNSLVQQSLDMVKERLKQAETEQELYTKLLNQQTISTKNYPALLADAVITQQEEYNMNVKLQKQEIERWKNAGEDGKQQYQTARTNLDIYKKRFRAEVLNKLDTIQSQIQELSVQQATLSEQLQQMTITAPADGYVNDLTVATNGQVLGVGQQVASIIPQNATFAVEADALNQDIGQLQVGQTCAIKLDAYPYQKYGTLEGQLTRIADTSTANEANALVYAVNVEFTPTEQAWEIKSGMTATVEVKTGQKRIIRFLLDPILRHVDEGIKGS